MEPLIDGYLALTMAKPMDESRDEGMGSSSGGTNFLLWAETTLDFDLARKKGSRRLLYSANHLVDRWAFRWEDRWANHWDNR
jgi:hypothetical protein